MTNFEKAVEIVVEDIRNELDDLDGITCWDELLDAWGTDSDGMKEDIRWTLREKARSGEIQWCYTDTLEIEEEDGTIKTYRQLTNAIRKQLFSAETATKEETPSGITVTAEQVERIKRHHRKVMNIRYQDPGADDDEYWRGCMMGLEAAMGALGIEYEQWNPMAGL